MFVIMTDVTTVLCSSPCFVCKYKLENVSIANALQLGQPDAAQSLSALISSPVPSLKSLSLSVAVLERLYVTLRYAVTLNFDPVTLTFDL